MKNSSSEVKMKTNKYAPVVVFGYNRADMLANLFDSLEKNEDVEKMDLYLFLDIPGKKKPRDIPLSKEVIAYANIYKAVSKFKRVEIEVATQHKGLADSIISGVSKIINKYGKVIVLEDDLVVSNDFLDYMQRGLEFYKKDYRVWSITAHSPLVKFIEKYKSDVFLAPRIESWGWGTWKNRWDHVDWDVASYGNFKRDFMGQVLFNLGGNNLCKMLDCQMMNSEYDSWAIRWCYQQFRERKYTIYPKESRVIHCGNDNRSTHGVYYSRQKIKDVYKKCEFKRLKPNCRVIWNFRRASSISIIEKYLKN